MDFAQIFCKGSHFLLINQIKCKKIRSPTTKETNEDIFWYKNTPSVMAAKIVKNNRGVYLRQFTSIRCQFLSIHGYIWCWCHTSFWHRQINVQNISRQCVTLRLFFIQKYASLRSLQKYTKIFSGVILVVRCRCTPSIVAKLSVCCSSQLGIIQLLYPLMLHYRASLLPIISNVLRTFHSPSE